jgi:hypothetical protein
MGTAFPNIHLEDNFGTVLLMALAKKLVSPVPQTNKKGLERIEKFINEAVLLYLGIEEPNMNIIQLASNFLREDFSTTPRHPCLIKHLNSNDSTPLCSRKNHTFEEECSEYCHQIQLAKQNSTRLLKVLDSFYPSASTAPTTSDPIPTLLFIS